MIAPRPADPQASYAGVRSLFWLRWIALAGQVAAIAISTSWLGMALPLVPLVATIASLGAINLLTGWWLRRAPAGGSIDRMLLAQLLLDVLALSVLLYFTGGSTNPFVSLYLLPIAIAAAVLRPAQVWFVVGITSLCYSLLMVWFVPLPHVHGLHDHTSPFSLHVLGMWLTFMLAAALIALFVVRMAASLRERDQQLARAREEQLRDEQIVGLGTLAAGTAHELGTPLATMAVLAKELEHSAPDEAMRADLRLLRAQVDRCKTILARLSGATGGVRAEGGRAESLAAALSAMLERWRVQHPQTRLEASIALAAPERQVVLDLAFEQALHNLMNNAAQASPARIAVTVTADDRQLELVIADDGPGLDEQALARAGQLYYSTKGDAGLGMGIFLANATVERMGGQVHLANRGAGGARATIRIPLSAIAVNA